LEVTHLAKGSRSALKNQRKSDKRRQDNKVLKTRIKTSAKKIIILVEEKNQEKASAEYIQFSSIVDRAVKNDIIDRNNAARKKSRLQKKINSIGKS